MDTKKVDIKVYVLIERETYGVRGIYDSTDKLRKGVDHWAGRHPGTTMHYEVWTLNNPEGPVEWDWAFIATNSSREELEETTGGADIPEEHHWGRNMCGANWDQYMIYYVVEDEGGDKEGDDHS